MPGSVRALAGLPKQVVTGGMALKWKVEGMNLLELWGQAMTDKLAWVK